MRVPTFVALLSIGAAGGAYFQHLLTTPPFSLLREQVHPSASGPSSSLNTDTHSALRLGSATVEPVMARDFSSPRQLATNAGRPATPNGLSGQPEPTLVSGPEARSGRALAKKQPTDIDLEVRKPLVSEIQRELRRLACYRGALDGDWGPNTVAAARVALARVDESLPTIQPDFVILSLLRRQPSGTCGVAHPDDRSIRADGQSSPRAVITTATKSYRSTPVNTTATSPETNNPEVYDTASRTIVVPFPTVAERPRDPPPPILDPASRMAIGAPVNTIEQIAAGQPGNVGAETVGIAAVPEQSAMPRRTSIPAKRSKSSLNDPAVARRFFFGPGGS